MILYAVIDGKTHKRIAQFFLQTDAEWFQNNPPDYYEQLIVEPFGSVG